MITLGAGAGAVEHGAGALARAGTI